VKKKYNLNIIFLNVYSLLNEYQHDVTKCAFKLSNWKLLRLSSSITLYFEKLLSTSADTMDAYLKQEISSGDNSAR